MNCGLEEIKWNRGGGGGGGIGGGFVVYHPIVYAIEMRVGDFTGH
jgi:hypothetical protein